MDNEKTVQYVKVSDISEIKFDFSKVSDMTKRLLGSSLYKDLIEHFKNPENQRKFEEWKKERKKERGAAK